MQRTEFVRITPYYNHHVAQGAEMYMKGGWVRPVRFATPTHEALATRTDIGLIDGHSMGKIRVIGKDARALMRFVMANDLDRIEIGRGAIYSCLCDQNGGIIDDVIVYAINTHDYFLITNTLSGPRVDAWLQKVVRDYGFDAYVLNDTNKTAYIAIQGPKTPDLLDRILPPAYRELNYFEFATFTWENLPILVARTGFTGEIGFEFYFASEFGHDVWERLLEIGAPLGIRPVGGLGVQILRIEKSYRAYTLDMTQDDTPFEAGLGWSVRLDSHDFIGRDALRARKAEGVQVKLMGYVLDRSSEELGAQRDLTTPDGAPSGRITSICDSPALGKTVAMARVPRAAWGTQRLMAGPAVLTQTTMPFFDPQGQRLKTDLTALFPA